MRTNIDIDATLLAEAMQITGQTTKKATVEDAIRRMIDGKRRLEALEKLWDTGWDGDLDEMRRDIDD